MYLYNYVETLFVQICVGRNAVGVESISEYAPKVGVVRQPWAGGHNPVGIVRIRLLRIPTGFRPKTQGREARATLGHGPQIIQPQRGCGHSPSIARDIRHNRVAVDDLFHDDPR